MNDERECYRQFIPYSIAKYYSKVYHGEIDRQIWYSFVGQEKPQLVEGHDWPPFCFSWLLFYTVILEHIYIPHCSTSLAPLVLVSGAMVRFALHYKQYSLLRNPSATYICIIWVCFYLHTNKLELCILFFNILLNYFCHISVKEVSVDQNVQTWEGLVFVWVIFTPTNKDKHEEVFVDLFLSAMMTGRNQEGRVYTGTFLPSVHVALYLDVNLGLQAFMQ